LCWVRHIATSIIERGWKMARYVNCKGCKNQDPDCGDISEKILDCQLWWPKKNGLKKYI
jgi:hypothetical protein